MANEKKQIIHRGENVTVSRTGGVNLRKQMDVEVGDQKFNVTLNSKHGARVSTKVAKGTSVYNQNGKTGIRGRWKLGGDSHVNASKSGFSLSTKMFNGTYNWKNPLRSGATLFGMTFRGLTAVRILEAQMFFWALVILTPVLWIASLASPGEYSEGWETITTIWNMIHVFLAVILNVLFGIEIM